ncbi:hypothetical protein CC80DRAFT_94370 [Byssothecium circinans]|uniref:Uncharacterized protein n=1 Tax=Byssothecium circinans TaxID=147558 RepID=A0A6A5TSY8_9PLEO|nr:hypothetical protein CC80DRAFT_94370 [Byssothecium circinans]
MTIGPSLAHAGSSRRIVGMSSHALPASSPRALVRSLYPQASSIGSARCLFNLATLGVAAAPSPHMNLHRCQNVPFDVSPLVWILHRAKQSCWPQFSSSFYYRHERHS